LAFKNSIWNAESAKSGIFKDFRPFIDVKLPHRVYICNQHTKLRRIKYIFSSKFHRTPSELFFTKLFSMVPDGSNFDEKYFLINICYSTQCCRDIRFLLVLHSILKWIVGTLRNSLDNEIIGCQKIWTNIIIEIAWLGHTMCSLFSKKYFWQRYSPN
jgi:hypothetical protein